MSLSTPPKEDEFEISIIGPGRGECILLHLGDNEWCVVDSCTAKGSSESVAIEYLNGFVNGAANRVRLVVATHWHDDHIRGLASILRQAPTASFYCSAAVQSENVLKLLTVAKVDPGRSGVDEFAAILGVIGQRPQAGRFPAPKLATENRKLDLPITGRHFASSVTALSPSDTAVAIAHAEIAKLLPQSGEPQRRVPDLPINHTSVALWVEAGPLRALLGADLEHTELAGEGWMAVLACHGDRNKAVLFKVPHHGSRNADCPEVWKRMLATNPLAVVTPFSSSRLPGESDLRRLRTRTDSLYCTAERPASTPRRDTVVEKMMRREVSERRVIDGLPGHVRVRWSPGNAAPNAVELFHGAYKVPDLAAAR